MNIKDQTGKIPAPLILIVAVLLAVILIGWYMISSNNGNTQSNKNAAKANTNTQKPPAGAIPPGAVPPNFAGSVNSPVVVEEFADFQCPQCANSNPVFTEIKSLYGSRIKFIFRNFPLAIPAHDKSFDAAVAVEAAGQQGKFWEMQHQLFSNQQAWTANPNYKQMWADYAKNLGLDVDKFKTDMAGVFTKGRVEADMARGRGLGVNSTPSLYINEVPVAFPDMNVSKLKELIDAELQKAAAGNAAPASAPAAPANAAPASAAK